MRKKAGPWRTAEFLHRRHGSPAGRSPGHPRLPQTLIDQRLRHLFQWAKSGASSASRQTTLATFGAAARRPGGTGRWRSGGGAALGEKGPGVDLGRFLHNRHCPSGRFATPGKAGSAFVHFAGRPPGGTGRGILASRMGRSARSGDASHGAAPRSVVEAAAEWADGKLARPGDRRAPPQNRAAERPPKAACISRGGAHARRSSGQEAANAEVRRARVPGGMQRHSGLPQNRGPI